MIRIRFFGPGELKQNGLGTAQYSMTPSEPSWFDAGTGPVTLVKGVADDGAWALSRG